ncbi:acrylyl-CoA reductase (NADPH) [Craterilacuibacter sp.]|uniref:acrylyl-CoA reductase (NADPH) n=1 Tax=Craterilacuibacter sp. TaxID=2870909 RepID=UPI003F3AFD47
MFRAIVIDKQASGQTCAVRELDDSALPAGDVTIAIEYSTLNYKDGLAISGSAPVVRSFPMVPGIDFAGEVVASEDPRWPVGKRVLLNGWGVGERHWGGLSTRARVSGDWLVALPEGMSARQAMAIGTAGYTAMLCVMALQKHGLKPEDGDILVTGASGGVGSIALMLLKKLGYSAWAMTGKAGEEAYLREIGAAGVMDRAEYQQASRPLERERWAGVIDCVGGTVLAHACACVRYDGAVAACGLAGGMDLPATVAPFILRGVTLYGIDSVMCPHSRREAAWQQLATLLGAADLEANTREIGLDEAIAAAQGLSAGQHVGRFLVRV